MKSLLRYRALLVFLLMTAFGLVNSSPQESDKEQAKKDRQADEQIEPGDPLGRTTPHGTVVGFLQAAQNGKYSDAAQYLQLSKTERAVKGEQIARQLEELMDEAFVGRVGTISSRRQGSPTGDSAENYETIGAFRVDDSETNVDLVRVSDARA